MQTLFGNPAQEQAPINAPQPAPLQPPVYRTRQEVVVVDFEMSLGSMIVFLFKWLLASITVGVVVSAVLLILMVVFGALGAASLSNLPGRSSPPAVTK